MSFARPIRHRPLASATAPSLPYSVNEVAPRREAPDALPPAPAPDRRHPQRVLPRRCSPRSWRRPRQQRHRLRVPALLDAAIRMVQVSGRAVLPLLARRPSPAIGLAPGAFKPVWTGGLIRAGFPALDRRTPDIGGPEHGHKTTADYRGGSDHKALKAPRTALPSRAQLAQDFSAVHPRPAARRARQVERRDQEA